MPQAMCKSCDQPFEFSSQRGVPVYAAAFKPTICDPCWRRQRDAESAAEAEAELATRNVPRRYAEATFEHFVASTVSQRQALEACRDRPDKGVFLVGRAGIGKTFLGACAVKAGPAGSLFIATTELMDDIKASFDGGGHGLLERAKRAPLLVLDDLGAEHVTEFVRDRLNTLLDDRWKHCRTLIVTTNCQPQSILTRIGEGGASRISGMCECRIEVKGEDRRRTPAGASGKAIVRGLANSKECSHG